MDRPSKKLSLDANSCSLLNAIRKNNDNEVLILIEYEADINPESDDWIESPLLNAIYQGHIKIAEILVFNGAEVDKKYSDGRTPIHWATRYNQKEIIKILVDHGADVDAEYGDVDDLMAILQFTQLFIKITMRLLVF